MNTNSVKLVVEYEGEKREVVIAELYGMPMEVMRSGFGVDSDDQVVRAIAEDDMMIGAVRREFVKMFGRIMVNGVMPFELHERVEFYLKRHGWTKTDDPIVDESKAAVYTHPAGDDVIVPRDTSLADYDRRMEEVASEIVRMAGLRRTNTEIMKREVLM